MAGLDPAISQSRHPRFSQIVMAGLDPAISSRAADHRVKPGDDDI